MSSLDVHHLIERAKRRDSEAVARLYEMHAGLIYRYIAYRVPTAADAEDLTAEVFVAMVKGLADYRYTGAPFEAWLYRIAAARVSDFHRRRNRRPQAELGDSLRDLDPLPEEHLEEKQELETLRAALTRLTDEQQHILLLRFIEHKSHQEVADIVGKSVSAVKSIQHRALLDLTRHLGSEEKVRHYFRGGSHD